MDSEKLHKNMDARITPHNINEIQHVTCKLTHIADGFGHGATNF